MPRRAASADAAPRAADDRAVEALGALLERQFEAMRAEQRANHEEVLKETFEVWANHEGVKTVKATGASWLEVAIFLDAVLATRQQAWVETNINTP